MLHKECKQCGARLTIREDEAICEYCGASYELPEKYKKKKHKIKPVHSPKITQYPPPPAYSTPQIENKKKTGYGKFFFIFLVLGVLAIGFTRWSSNSDSAPTKHNPESQTEKEIYERDSALGPYTERPAGFIHTDTLSIGAIYNGSESVGFDSNKSSKVNVYIKNNNDFLIDSNSKSDFLRIDSVKISDNAGTQYKCETFPTSEQLNPVDIGAGKVAVVARFYCNPQISPEVKFINVNTVLSNWGTYDLQIPITLDIDIPQIQYKVYRDRGGKLDVDISFYADPPQPIGLYYEDVSLIDDNGKIYTKEFCDTGNTAFPNHPPDSDINKHFSLLAENTGHGADLGCRFTESLDPDADAITLIMTIRGKTVTLTAPIDTIEGPILFNSEEE